MSGGQSLFNYGSTLHHHTPVIHHGAALDPSTTPPRPLPHNRLLTYALMSHVKTTDSILYHFINRLLRWIYFLLFSNRNLEIFSIFLKTEFLLHYYHTYIIFRIRIQEMCKDTDWEIYQRCHEWAGLDSYFVFLFPRLYTNIVVSLLLFPTAAARRQLFITI